MNRRRLETHLRTHGCELHHHGKKHDVWWNPENEQMASLPRHRTVKKPTARAICRSLDVPLPPGL